MNITPILEDYLERILIMQQQNTVARVKDLANYFQVKAPSVVDALKKLKSMGLIEHEFYGFVVLTAKGKSIAQEIYNKHLLLKDFLKKVLHVNELVAEDDACKIEHYLSKETINNIIAFMNFAKTSNNFSQLLDEFYRIIDTKLDGNEF